MPTLRTAAPLLLVLVLVVGGVLLAHETGRFLLFHALAETFSSVVAAAVFLLAWNTRRVLGVDRFLMVIGSTLLWVGLIDLLHMLAYRGMGVFTGDTVNLATQLWIAARGLFSVAIVGAVLVQNRAVGDWAILAVPGVIATLLVGAIAGGYFPDCYVPGHGLTLFKVTAEYIICALLVTAGGLLWWRRAAFDARLTRHVGAAIALTIVSELGFTLYSQPDDLTNAVGHLLKIGAYFMLYKALVELGVRDPYALVFRELKASELALAQANQTLEQRVAQRTQELRQRRDQLRDLARELTLVERRERRRLATELHDELAQLLAAAKMRLGTSDGTRGPEVGQLLDEAIRVTRSLIADLSPPRLHESGLSDALHALAAQMHSRHHLTVHVTDHNGVSELPDDVRETVFNAVRELLMNTVKHGGTEQASVHLLNRDGGGLRVVVEDGGRGFDPAALPERPTHQGGFGLSNIRELLDLAGAGLRVESAPGKGVRATIDVPQ